MRNQRDEAKNRANQSKHGIGFEEMERFEWESAVVLLDDRWDYGELRESAIGFIGVKLYHVPFAGLEKDLTRIISLRAATKREQNRYAKEVR